MAKGQERKTELIKFRVSKKEKAKIMQRACLISGGNISELSRQAALTFVPMIPKKKSSKR